MRSRLMLSVVGCHAEGEVGDVIVGGFLPPPGATMFDRMRAMERDFDHVRRFLLCEPRGSVCRHVNLLTPPINAGCDVGVIIMEPTEYVPMSGSNLICTVTVILETGIVPIKEPETIVMVDTPAGPVKAVAECRDGRCRSVEFENVPSFVDRLDAAVEVAGLGTVDRRRGLRRDVLRDRGRDEAWISRGAFGSARARRGGRADPARRSRATGRRPPGKPGDSWRFHRPAQPAV